MPPPGSAPSRHRLGCVAVPIVAADIAERLAALFALWACDRFLPVLEPDTPRPHLMIVINNATPGQCAAAEALFRDQPRLAGCFSGMSAHSADLTGDRDLYTLNPNARRGAFGSKSGPNLQFARTMALAGMHPGYTLQIELDCLPVRAGWVEAVQTVIDGNARAWVIGSVFAGDGHLDPASAGHLNGNGLYKAGSAAFLDFLHGTWLPGLLGRIREHPDLAYDLWWSLERARADSKAGNAAWRNFQTYDGFFHTDPFIVNLLVAESGARDYRRVFDKFAALDRTPVFLHGPLMHRLCPRLLAHPEDGIFEALDRLAPPQDQPAPPPHPEPAPRDDSLLMRLSARTLNGDAASAQLLLNTLCAQLLLSPEETAAQLETRPALAQAVTRARQDLGREHPLIGQYDYALDRAVARKNGNPPS